MNATAGVTKWNNSDKRSIFNDRHIAAKTAIPQKGTIEYLFKDYSGESFKTELVNPTEAIGEEKW
jgi:hypothetical protein